MIPLVGNLNLTLAATQAWFRGLAFMTPEPHSAGRRFLKGTYTGYTGFRVAENQGPLLGSSSDKDYDLFRHMLGHPVLKTPMSQSCKSFVVRPCSGVLSMNNGLLQSEKETLSSIVPEPRPPEA